MHYIYIYIYVENICIRLHVQTCRKGSKNIDNHQSIYTCNDHTVIKYGFT